MTNMKMIDLHCDTILRLYGEDPSQNLMRNNFHVDLEKLKNSDSLAQFFALFIDLEETRKNGKDPWIEYMGMHSRFASEMMANKDAITLAMNSSEMEHNEKEGKISAFLTVEEGGIIEDQIERLDTLHDMGIRLITLTWNYINSIGYPNGEETNTFGLKPFGKDVVEKMKEKKMIVDVSHLSDAGFYDVADILKSPFTASHSSVRAIRNHGRNLTDDMLKTIGNTGSIVGVNFCPFFLTDEPYMQSVDALVKHIDYMVNTAGIEAVALGTDFDGIYGEMEIEHIGEMSKLYEGLKRIGYGEDKIERIWNLNAKRFIKDVLG